jgi:hypothetical protein
MNRKSLFFRIIIILLVALVGVFCYFKIQNSREIITLSPQEGETKRKPDDPGGIVIPNLDSLVYEKLQKGVAKNRKINILPEPEVPMDLGQKVEDNPVIYLDSIDEILANIEYHEEDVLDNNLATTDELVIPNAIKSSMIVESEEEKQKIEIPGTELNIIKSSDNRFKVTEISVVSAEDDGYKIHLTTAFSEGDAKKLWQEITKRHGKVLNGANLITKKIDSKNERIFYLVMAGTYPSLNHAKLVCNRLAARKQNCIVTK